MEEKLAIDGGEKAVISKLTDKSSTFPMIYPETEQKLVELYRKNNWSFNGPYEREFDEKFAAYNKAAYGVFMANGTVTLECALAALGVGPGDEVIVPAHTWIATGMCARYVGATPVIVDIEPDTLCMDPKAFEAAITPRTKAVIPVHLFGSMADMDSILAIANKHGIAVVEDCAHAHGARWKDGKGVGSKGAISSFSFQQSKLMTSGEGGICLTSDENLFERLDRLSHIGYPRGIKQGGATTKPAEDLLCRNYRSTDFQAVILLGMLEHLEELSQLRAKNAAYIRERIEKIPGMRTQAPGKNVELQSYYNLTMLVDESVLKPGITRKEVVAALQAEGVGVWAGWANGATIFQQTLWNVPEKNVRFASFEVAERVCKHEQILLGFHCLMADDFSYNDEMLHGFEKVMKAYSK